jgi:hypothetical protein
MKPLTTPLVAAMAALAAGAALAQAPTSPAAEPLRVHPLQIIDRQGFEKPYVAYTMFVPAGWRSEATVRWNVQAPCSRSYQPVFKAESADGQQVLELTPGEGWGRGSMGPLAQGCPTWGIQSAEQYLQGWVQKHRAGARVLELRTRADKVQRPPPMQGAGYESRRVLDVAQALIEWPGATPQRELLVTVVNFGHTRMAGMGGLPPIEAVSGEAAGVLAWRAPGAGPDARAFDALWSSFRQNPEWAGRIAAVQQQMAQENAQTQMQISQLQHQGAMDTLRQQAQRGENAHRARQEMAEMQSQGWRDRQQSSDRQQQANVQAIRGVTAWRDAGGATVELPDHYRHAWKLKDGSYVLTDDPNFDPARQLRVEGQALKPAR